MDNKILVNSAIATKQWRNVVSKVLLFFCVSFPFTLLIIPIGLIWLISLGHISFVGVWMKYSDKIDNKIFKAS